MGSAVIFGGTGFVGLFFAKYLIEKNVVEKVYLYDLKKISEKGFVYRRDYFSGCERIEEIIGDVRSEIIWRPKDNVVLIANFAAVHREPGHVDYEYFETNILGAENVCKWAEKVSCDKIIFTSSISPYGISEAVKDEKTLPVPITPYGSSKLAAEKIHQTWLAGDQVKRKLIIVRPGVVFGPTEGGNVSRLIKAIKGGYFFYMGNKETRKAGVYVKELNHAILWVLNKMVNDKTNFCLFNMSMMPGPSIEEYVKAIQCTLKVKKLTISVPYRILLFFSYLIDFCAKPFAIKHPFSPVRIKKLVRSNNIIPSYLVENNYPYQYTLETALEDWKNESPNEW